MGSAEGGGSAYSLRWLRGRAEAGDAGAGALLQAVSLRHVEPAPARPSTHVQLESVALRPTCHAGARCFSSVETASLLSYVYALELPKRDGRTRSSSGDPFAALRRAGKPAARREVRREARERAPPSAAEPPATDEPRRRGGNTNKGKQARGGEEQAQPTPAAP